MQLVLKWMKKNAVVCIAFILAVVSACIVPPDEVYLGYFDVKTLCCLFGTLAIVCALKNIRFFSIMARRIIRLTGNARTAAVAVTYITFIGSMLIANDMALITFLPLGYLIFSAAGRREDVATVFILQNIAANLGGMLTPFGNPQNLYLYTYFNIPTDEFMGIMFLPFIISITLVTLCCFFVKKNQLQIVDRDEESMKLPPLRTVIYLTLFAMTILMVFRVLPIYIVVPVVLAALLVMDRKALTMVDYGLLMTFVCFFVFAGNVSRIEAVRQMFSTLLSGNTLLTAVFSCQVISNVPTAILLSRFANNYASLLVGVNIGGVGTLISSLASLITFREYTSHFKSDTKNYLLRFSAFNFSFLAILVVSCLLMGR